MRVLVDRLWPRGLSKEKTQVDVWLKDIAPSGGLRKWYGHKEERWDEFKRRYFEELKKKGKLANEIKELGRDKKATLLYAARDTSRNNAHALLEFLVRGDE